MTRKKKLLTNCIKGFLSLVVLSLFAVITSCNNDDPEPLYDVTHKVMYKVEVSAGSTIKSIKYNEPGNPDVKSATTINGTMWTGSEIISITKVAAGQVVHSGTIAIVEATGANASSTAKVQIYVDGVLKQEKTSTGQNLDTKLEYTVEYKIN